MRSQTTRVQREVAGDAFREAMRQWTTGIALVSALVDGRPQGLLVNSLTSVSLDPPLVAFCPSRASLTWSRMRTAGRFGINVLDADSAEYARRAAVPGVDRFSGLPWELTTAGAPALSGALAFLQGRHEITHRGGDHWIVVLRVEGARARSAGAPLVRWDGRYGRLCGG